MTMKKIGIMGGTFDPIHNGHIMLGRQAYEEYDLDCIWYMPSRIPPHKKDHTITAAKDRLAIMDIEKWYHPEYVLPAVTFLAAAREHEEADRSLDEQISYLNQKYQAHILRLHCREMDVASAEIRAAFRAGHAADVRSLVPKEVCQYIEQHGLYQEVNV